MTACKRGHTEIVKLLLARENIDVDAQNKHGQTAFMLACMVGNLGVVKVLLDYPESIDFNCEDYLGRTAFVLAGVWSGDREEVRKLLLKNSHRVDVTRIW